MSTLKIGIHIVPVASTRNSQSKGLTPILVRQGENMVSLDAELLDIGPRFCRLRIARDRYHFDSAEVGIQFAWSDLVARIIWTNTTDEHVELGLLLPDMDEEV
jgi:hypothetical protein